MKRYINFWVMVGAAAVALALLCVLIVSLWVIRPENGRETQSTAVLHVIPYLSPTPVPVTPSPAATEPISEDGIPPAPPPGDITLEAYVQVSGTGGEGLRLRADAGLQGEVKFLGLESEIFLVEDGPMQVDGYTWWFLVAPYDESVQGWAVSNYLVVAQNP